MIPEIRRHAPLLLILAVWAFLSSGLLWGTRLNSDEGFYLAASKAAGAGLVPYRDYAYTQMPLLPFLQAPFLEVLPASLGAIRILSMAWTTLALVLAYRILRITLGAAPTLACLAVFLVSVDALGFLSIGKTYALANLLFLAAALALFPMRPWRVRLLLLSVAGVLCVGVRLTMAPSVAVLWAGFWVLNRGEVRAVWMMGIPAALSLALIGPFVTPDPQRFEFFNWGFHTFSFVQRHPAGFWLAAAMFAPGPLAFAGLACTQMRRPTPSSVLLTASVSGFVANLAFAGAYTEYETPFVLPAIVGAAGVLGSSAFKLEWGAYAAAVIGGLLFLHTPDASTCVGDARGAADFLRAHTARDDSVLASMPEIPVGAGRPIFRNLLMGKFTVTGDLPASLARRYGFIHIGELINSVELRQPAAVVLSASPSGNFATSYPSEIKFAGIHRRLMAALSLGYALAFSNRTYVVLLRREPGSEGPADALAGL